MLRRLALSDGGTAALEDEEDGAADAEDGEGEEDGVDEEDGADEEDLVGEVASEEDMVGDNSLQWNFLWRTHEHLVS